MEGLQGREFLGDNVDVTSLLTLHK
jgi:hypothetical protein